MEQDPLPPSTPRPERPEPPPHREQRAATGGIALVLIGIFFLLNNFFPNTVGRSFLLLVGVAFLLAYFMGRRRVGFLIPGGIVSGLGLGVLLAQWFPGRESGGIVLLCMAAGFGSIWIFERSQRWALIPGGILALIGAFVLTSELAGLGDLRLWWPAILILLGLWVLLSRVQASRRGG